MGVLLSSASTICLAVAGILYSYCFWLKPNLNPSVIAIVRVMVGFLPPLFFILKKRSIMRLMGNNRKDLLFWGLAGSATVTTFFFSTQLVGVGITQMLSSVQGLVFFFGAPLLLNESPKWKNLVGLILSIIGLNFILSSRTTVLTPMAGVSIVASKSILFGIFSGVFGGIAYLFMARCRKTDCPEVIAFYWAVPSLLMQLLIIFYGQNHLLNNSDSAIYSYTNSGISNVIWLCAFFGGVLTAVSQILLAEAYRYGNVVLLSLITYLGPLINLMADLIIGKIFFNSNLLIGVLLIIFGSGIFPFLKQTSMRSVANRLYKVILSA